MSMPGFVFYFRCDPCNATSEEYSIFPFHDILQPDIVLPAWSLMHKCWSRIQLWLSSDQRIELEAEPEHLSAFAKSITSAALTVCVPQFNSNLGVGGVSITPDPICPKCGEPCQAIFGCPTREQQLRIPSISPEELSAVPLAAIDVSIRTRNVCTSLGIRTLGQLRLSREIVLNHKQSTASLVAEVERWLSLDVFQNH